jgi:hypothetical protein
MAYGGPIDQLILAQVAELVVRHSERDAEREVVPHFRHVRPAGVADPPLPPVSVTSRPDERDPGQNPAAH